MARSNRRTRRTNRKVRRTNRKVRRTKRKVRRTKRKVRRTKRISGGMHDSWVSRESDTEEQLRLCEQKVSSLEKTISKLKSSESPPSTTQVPVGSAVSGWDGMSSYRGGGASAGLVDRRESQFRRDLRAY